MNLSEINRKKVLKRWEKYQEIERSNITNNKEDYIRFMSRLLGFLAGDGNIDLSKRKNNQKYSVRFYPDHLSLIKPFEESIEKLYKRKVITKPRGNHYGVLVHSRVIVEDILKFGSIKTKEWRVPNSLLENKESKVEWLRAFFDCEGYVGKNHIKINCVNIVGLRQVRTLLNAFEINSKFYIFEPKNKRWSKYGILRIGNKVDLIKYNNIVGFNHKIKSQKLLKIIDY